MHTEIRNTEQRMKGVLMFGKADSRRLGLIGFLLRFKTAPSSMRSWPLRSYHSSCTTESRRSSAKRLRSSEPPRRRKSLAIRQP